MITSFTRRSSGAGAGFVGLLARLMIGLGALAALAGCASRVNPATGQSERLMLSPSDEQRMGDEQHPKILQSMGGVYDDRRVTGYVAEIGGRLARNSELPANQWTFTVLDSPVINAFALPGGYVYVTRGLVALANSEAELAGVIGHEIGHVTARHTAQRYDRAVTANIFGAIASIGAAVAGVDPNLVGQAASIAGRGYVASFSREQELEADRLGVRYIARAGYDPYAQADFLESMQMQTALNARMQGKSASATQVDFFSTHPATADRTRAAIASAGQLPVSPDAPRRRDAFLSAIDGMVYGDSPREGFVRGRSFVHPDLRFEWTAPPGFSLTNTSQAVRGDGPNGAKLLFTGGGQIDRSPGADVQVWARALAQKGQVGSLSAYDEFTTPSARGATGVVRVASQGQAIEARLISLGAGGRIYRFAVLYPEQMGRGLDGDLRDMAFSFRRLSASEAGSVRPYRIDIVTVRSGDTVQSLARRMPFDDFRVERFQVLNGLRPGERLRAGDKVKVVVR